MHSFITITLASAIALTAAAPHAHNHQHLHAPRAVKLPSLAGRAEDLVYGVCGGDSGFTCGPGYCCSSWGYCGTSQEYCSDGCQSQFGTCGSNSTGSGIASGTLAAPNSTFAAPTSILAATTSTPAATTSAIAATSTALEVSSSTLAAAAGSSSQSAGINKAHSQPTWGSWSGSGFTPSAYSSPAEISTSAAPTTTTSAAAVPITSSYSAPAAPTTTLQTSTSAAAPTSYSQPSTSSTWAVSNSAAASSSTSASSSAASPSSTSSGGSGLGNTYKVYTGDGTTGSGWPSQSEWVSDFDTMWSANLNHIKGGCSGTTPQNTDSETSELQSTLTSIASQNNVDPRFALAIMMQESGGCVRVNTTSYSVTNPGLFQSHEGTGTCNTNTQIQDPCPSSEISQMVTDGVVGTASSSDYSLQGTLKTAACSDVSQYYKAARIYNSGSIPSDGNLSGSGATSCYASDIANRLTGWVSGNSGCGS